MAERRSGAGAAFAVLIALGLLVKLWVWIVALLGAAVVIALLYWVTGQSMRRADADDARRAALVARADQQHAWALAGDERGIYGEYRPTQI
jgi:uncharacterized SAM-binding protein YcdF (DUF218 family)